MLTHGAGTSVASRAAAVLCALAIGASAALAAERNLVAGGSFEAGAQAPVGWEPGSGGKWLAAGARTGSRCLGLSSQRDSVAWSSEGMPLEAGQSYRLDGWIRCSEGSARLGLDLLDGSGRVIRSAAAPAVSAAPGWRFTAVEVDAPAEASAGRVWFRGKGEARLDDLVLAPMISNLLMNPGFDADAKGRLAYWGEEKQAEAPGARAGSHKGAPAPERGGSALLIEAPDGWWAVSSVRYPLRQGITGFRFAGWARCDKGSARILVAWIDDFGKALRTDVAAAIEAESPWTRYEDADFRRPRGASAAQIVAVVEKGTAWFDDFAFTAWKPASRRTDTVRVHVNQVGYDAARPKSLVVATNFFPRDSLEGSLSILSQSGDRALTVPLSCDGRIYDGQDDDWGEYFWRVDLSSLREPGTYRAIAKVGGASGESPPFRIGPGLLFSETAAINVDFFFVQRCGCEVPGWHKPCHLDDARLPDGVHIDATGGWHSAGDYNKPVWEFGDGGAVYALLTAWKHHPVYFAHQQREHPARPDVVQEARWGADFLAKIQKEDGSLWASVNQGPGRTWMKWAPPDTQTDNIIGTDDDPVIVDGEGYSPLSIGGWARLSKALEDRGGSDYLSRAQRLWDHMTAQGAGVGNPLLVWSALEMHAVTGEKRYRDFARASAEKMLDGQVETGRLRGAFGDYGEYQAAALALFALAYPDDDLAPRIRAALTTYRRFCETTADNPFGLSKQRVGEQEYFFEPTSTLGHNWELLARAWAAILIYRLNGDERALRFAYDQIDWVLGKNDYGVCMLEGKGTVNPPRYHHRYATIPGHERGAVPGAIPNGFVRSVYGLDQPGFDMSRDHIPSYRTSEPWLVHNVFYMLAISALPAE